MTPPIPERRPHQHTEHGVLRDDPWHWLRDRGDPAVRAHLEAENRWTEERLAGLEPLRKQLYREFLDRIQETDQSAPEPWGPWEYYRRTVEGLPYGIHCRRPRGGGDEQVLLDENLLARGHEFSSVATAEPSPDHGTLAYSTDFTAGERHTLRFRDLATGIDLPDEVADTDGDIAWASDSRTVLYCALDQALRAHRIYRYTLGSGAPPTLVWEEPDEGFRLGVGRTRSGRFLILISRNASTTEVRLLPADAPDAEARVVQPRRRNARYFVEHAGRSLFLLTNVGRDDVPRSAVNHRLVELPLDGGPPIERIAHRDDAELVSLAGFADHLVVLERVRGQLGVRVLDLVAGTDRQATLPEIPSVIGLEETPEYDGGVVRLDYTSLTTPHTDYDLDLRTLEWRWLKEQPVRGYDRTRYRTERLEAPAADGVAIPMSVVYRADLDLHRGPHPTILYGYGSYGITMDPVFSGPRVSLLDRGVVFVIAHVRGGGFLGRSWYEAARFQRKAVSFTDFVACAGHLIDQGVTAPDRLAAWGGSAGGLLLGATINLAPELFRAALAAVPFVDVLTTMLDRTLPLTIPEFDEWGDPRDREVFDAIFAYSPYDNVRATRYPDVLATAGFNDPRVSYWEPAKWIARLRERASAGEFLLKTQLGAGHQGPSGRYGFLEERAYEVAWLLHEIGATHPR